MKYGEYWISTCRDTKIERCHPVTGEPEICEGYFCEVFDDPEYENRVDYFCLAIGYEISDGSDESLDKGIRKYLGLPLDEQKQKDKTNEMILAEDAVETTVYLANAPDCCSGSEQLNHVLGMLGANVMDDDIYHSEDQHPKMSM